MFNKSHLAGALFVAAVVAHDINTLIKRHSAAKTFLAAEAEFAEALAAFEKKDAYRVLIILHLCRLIDNSGIEVDEFDRIVLNFPYEA